MKINNKTNVLTEFFLYAPGGSECGTLDPGQSREFGGFWNDQKTVEVVFKFPPDNNPSIKVPGTSQATIEVKQGD